MAAPTKFSPRQYALLMGETTYFSKKPCPRGHKDGRYTSNCACITCQREVYPKKALETGSAYRATKRWREKNIERVRENDREYKRALRETRRILKSDDA